MKKILFTFFLLLSYNSFAQTFAYSFEGTLIPEHFKNFEMEFLSIKGVHTIEFRLKTEQQRGEIIFSTELPSSKDEDPDSQFTPSDVKQLLIRYSLNPLDFRRIK
jgi:hypothetical protein